MQEVNIFKVITSTPWLREIQLVCKKQKNTSFNAYWLSMLLKRIAQDYHQILLLESKGSSLFRNDGQWQVNLIKAKVP